VGLRSDISLERIGDVGLYWSVWAFGVSGESSFRNAFESAGNLGQLLWNVLDMLDCMGDMGHFGGLGKVFVLECIGECLAVWVSGATFLWNALGMLDWIGVCGHFGSREHHCFGMHLNVQAIWTNFFGMYWICWTVWGIWGISHFGCAIVMERIWEFGRFGSCFGMFWRVCRRWASGAHFFVSYWVCWPVLEMLEVLVLGRVIVLECVGEFVHFGSREGHSLGADSICWSVLEMLDISVHARVIVLEWI